VGAAGIGDDVLNDPLELRLSVRTDELEVNDALYDYARLHGGMMV
jgi:hypothetical protein